MHFTIKYGGIINFGVRGIKNGDTLEVLQSSGNKRFYIMKDWWKFTKIEQVKDTPTINQVWAEAF